MQVNRPCAVRRKGLGNDPLAELARLIGQTDPFGEFGRDTARRPPRRVGRARRLEHAANCTVRAARRRLIRVHRHRRSDRRATAYYMLAAGSWSHSRAKITASQNYGREPYERAGAAGGMITIKPTPKRVVIRLAKTTISRTATSKARLSSRTNTTMKCRPRVGAMGVMAIAGVFALALIGTAGAFGYRALFGSSGSPQPPPVIKADTAPSKIVPAASRQRYTIK